MLLNYLNLQEVLNLHPNLKRRFKLLLINKTQLILAIGAASPLLVNLQLELNKTRQRIIGTGELQNNNNSKTFNNFHNHNNSKTFNNNHNYRRTFNNSLNNNNNIRASLKLGIR